MGRKKERRGGKGENERGKRERVIETERECGRQRVRGGDGMKEEGKKKKEKVKTTGRIEEVMEITNGKY